MAIPASRIVSVIPRLIQAGGTDLEINGMVLSKNALIPMSSIAIEFASAADVGAYFGTTSDEYTAAKKYFLGYTNSFRKPTTLVIARRVDTALSAWTRGAKYSGTLATLKAVTNGGMVLTINGTTITLENLDFSACTSFSDVAGVIQTAAVAVLPGVTVAYSSLTGAFTITSPTAGAASTIAYTASPTAGTDLATLLCLTSSAGAVLSQGSAILSVADNMSAIKAVTDNWVSFTTLWAVDSTEALALSQWATDQGVDYLYVCWSTESALKTSGSTDSIADVLTSNGVSATCGIYGTLEYAMLIMAVGASIDWNRVNGVVAYAQRNQSGLSASVDSDADAEIILAKTWNIYGNYATRNDNFLRLYNGCMFGDYKFIDPYINAVWLKNVIQESVMVGLGQVNRVPYTPAGYTLIKAWLTDPVVRARKNGVIDVGVTLSESQKAQLYSEAGLDISDELFTNGYYVQVSDPGATVRVNRGSPNVSIWYTYGGNVNKLEIASTAVL